MARYHSRIWTVTLARQIRFGPHSAIITISGVHSAVDSDLVSCTLFSVRDNDWLVNNFVRGSTTY